jgi:hypothetical protein
MIVSHKNKFIFLKPRKVAGTSFEIALSKYLESDDIITEISPADEQLRKKLGFKGPRNNFYSPSDFIRRRVAKEVARAVRRKTIPRKFYNHIPAIECKEKIGADIWNEYTKISIVRNPWDVTISMYYWINGKSARLEYLTIWWTRNKHLLARNHQQYFIENDPIVDIFLRYENFETDIKCLEGMYPTISGLYDTLNGIRAKSGVRKPESDNLSEIYSRHPDLDSLIRVLHRYKIQTFEYSL